MKAIKHTLTERYYSWQDARDLAETDPEVDLADHRSPYTPSDYLEEGTDGQGLAAEAETEAQAGQEEQKIADSIDPSTLPKTPETVTTTTRP